MENTTSILAEYSVKFKNLDDEFRKMICKCCGWSEATYYRKRNRKDVVSNSHKESICNIADEILKNLKDNIEKLHYRYGKI